MSPSPNDNQSFLLVLFHLLASIDDVLFHELVLGKIDVADNLGKCIGYLLDVVGLVLFESIHDDGVLYFLLLGQEV